MREIKLHTSSYKITKSQGCNNVEHVATVDAVLTVSLKVAKKVNLKHSHHEKIL